MNRQRYWFLQVWLLLIAPSPVVVVARSPDTILAISVATAVPSSSSSSSSSSLDATNHDEQSCSTVIHTHDMQIGKLRTDFVKHILSQRLDYVISGRRTADFHAWIRKRGGEVAVLSTHGVVVDLEMISTTTTTTTTTIPSLTSTDKQFDNDKSNRHSSSLQVIGKKHDPFAANRLDLDLPVNTLPNLYEGKPIHLIEDLQPSLMQLLWRTVQLSIKFSPVLSTAWLAAISTKFRRMWYKWVAVSLGSTSAAFIKWGQWAATRSDMFPDLLCQELGSLQNSAPEHPWAFSEEVMESSLGLPSDSLMDVFDRFDKKPLASGSIAQVHKAELDGKPVAVKIRHPRVAQLIDMDFRIMTTLARICDWIPALSWLHIRESVEQFSHTMAAQAHLQVEAHHLEILNHNFRKWAHVKFPYPIYASSAVIIETFEPGVVVSDMLDAYAALAAQANNHQKGVTVEEDGEVAETMSGTVISDLIPVETAKFIVTNGVGLYLKMLLVDNLMHADLHPGNIMLAAVGKGQCPDTAHDMDLLVVKNTMESNALDKERAETTLRICLVDAGMVAQLTDDEATNFIGLLASLGQGNGRVAARFALRFSMDNNMGPEQREAFTADMEALFAERCNGYGTDVDVGDVLRGILGLIRKHHVRIDANYATLVVNCLCIQSMAFQVCPAYNVLDASEPLLRSYFDAFFEPDGTEKPRAKAISRFNRIMPIKYLQKRRNDDAFFRHLKEHRKIQ